MSLLSTIPLVGDLVKVVFGSREQRDSQMHNEQMQVYQQFGKEFRAIEGRTWWDSLWDGINRTPRPVITYGIIYLFYLCIEETEKFERAMVALKTHMPYEGWVTIWMVIGFWFGTKAVEKMPKAWGKLNALKRIAMPEYQKMSNSTGLNENNISDDEIKRPKYND